MKQSTYDSLSTMAKGIYDSANQEGGVLRKFLSPQERKVANNKLYYRQKWTRIFCPSLMTYLKLIKSIKQNRS
jgi:hypothetical protein